MQVWFIASENDKTSSSSKPFLEQQKYHSNLNLSQNLILYK